MGYIKLFTNTVDYQDYINARPLLPNVSLVEETDIVYYNPFVDYSKEEYMYVEALEDDTLVSFTNNATSGSLYYSLDKQEWNELSEAQTINSGEKVYFKGVDLIPEANNGIGTFAINKQCNVAGNVMSLLFGDDFVGKTDLSGYDYAFYDLFEHCKTIRSAENLILPATTLADHCYENMFYGCTSLTTAPELPATTLAEHCYQYMFNGCSSLTTAPELPVTTLADFCYQNMFYGCSSLTTAPELPATTLATYCYQNMFYGCTSLTSAPELPATTLKTYCYSYMFYGCTSLTSAPELPATSLANYCYRYMFQGCSSLNYIKALFLTEPNTKYTSNWVSGVSTTGTFVKNANATWNVTGVSGVPAGWEVVSVNPTL